jgi:IS30 family transposase
MRRPTPFSKKTLRAMADLLAQGYRRREIARTLRFHHSRLYREIERNPEFDEWLRTKEAASKWEREIRTFDLHPARRHKVGWPTPPLRRWF